MATTLFTILRKAYLALGQMEVTTATGGSTTTVVDTKLTESFGDDDLVNCSVFVIRDAGGASAAPEGEVGVVSDNVQSTGTLTLRAALTTAVAVGDTVGIVKNVWPLYTMIEIVNDALASLGTIQLVDTSLTTVSGQTEYALPVTLKHKVTNVQIQTNTETSNNEYADMNNWYIVPAAAGATGLLIFQVEPESGLTLKVWYEAEHPRLSAMSDVLSETIHSELATRLVVDRALEYQTRRTSGTDQFLLQTANKAMQDVEMARRAFSVPKRRHAKILTPGTGE